jgi:hypothetical protein
MSEAVERPGGRYDFRGSGPSRDGCCRGTPCKEEVQTETVEEEARRLRPGTGSGIVKTELECLPCFFGQITRTLNYAGVNGDRGRSILLKAEKIIARASLDEVPARTTTLIHRILREETGVDPYKQVKDSYNRIALDRLTRPRRMAEMLRPS